jgi:hypothetical protein
MSRSIGDDVRADHESSRDTREVTRDDEARHPERPAPDLRQPVRGGRGTTTYRLRESEWRTLDTVGTFRVVAETDVVRATGDTRVAHANIGHLIASGLIDRKTAIVNHTPTRLIVLTREGKALLEQHRESRGRPADHRYYAGFVKPRELAHDVQLYRAYQAERARIEADGGRVTRVVLDYELKRDYQAFLNRRDRPPEATVDADRQAFADARSLPIIDGHLELPDLRLEVERPDGSHETRDIEVVTAHYSRGQLAGKAKAGFALYRPGRGSLGGRSGDVTQGGIPFDPDHLEWLR